MSAEDTKRRQLGRGLSALFGEESEDYAELDRVRVSKPVPIEHLTPSRFQPRHRFDEEEIRGLVESIRENGILQPILVRRVAGAPDRYEIVAGERRWRAAQAAQLHEVPVIIKDLSDGDALEIALVENLQRRDLTPIEEAEGFQRLMEEFAHTQEDLARAVGKSRSHIANTVRLLTLPDAVKEMLEDGRLSAGHGRALLGASDPAARAREVVARGLNVRQTEALVRAEKGAPPRKKAPPEKDADTLALEREVSTLLGLKVTITHREGGGTVTIRYKTLEQLDGVLQRLSHTPHVARADETPSTAGARTPGGTDPGAAPPDSGGEGDEAGGAPTAPPPGEEAGGSEEEAPDSDAEAPSAEGAPEPRPAEPTPPPEGEGPQPEPAPAPLPSGRPQAPKGNAGEPAPARRGPEAGPAKTTD